MGLVEGKFPGQRFALLHLARPQIEQAFFFSRGLKDHQIPEKFEQVPAEEPEIVPGVENPVQLAKRGPCVPGDDGGNNVPVHLGRGNSQDAFDFPGGDGLIPREGDDLIQQGLRVTHAPLAHPSEEAEGVFFHLALLLLDDPRELLGDDTRRNPAELEHLTPAQNRVRDFLMLGGGEYKDDMGRGLFERLEKGIERPSRKHVHLVDDDRFIAAPGGPVAEPLAEIADMVHTRIGRAVDLQDVGMSAAIDVLA